MEASIIAFDDFTDIDVFFLWDLLNRVQEPGWRVRILGESAKHTSSTGIEIPMHGHISESTGCDVVLFSSGMGTRRKRTDPAFLSEFHLDPERQLIGSMCSGALLLAALGLLDGKSATTYPTARDLLASTGVAWWNGPSYGKAISRPPPAAWPRNTLRDGLSKRSSAPPNAKTFYVRSCR
jgi:transcriptional regulator GlxA family with amidase domain